MSKKPQRMWINQPSGLQPLHHLHGTRVLAHHEYDDTWVVYFLEGDTISMQVLRLWLSEGWPEKRTSKIEPEQVQISWDDGKCWESLDTPQQAQNRSEDFSSPAVFRGLYPGPVCTDPFAVQPPLA